MAKTKRRAKYFVWGALIVVVLYLALGPIPIRLHRQYQGQALAYGAQGEPRSCTVTLDGTYYVYLLRYNELFSTFDISLDARTASPRGVQTIVDKGTISPLLYWGDDVEYFHAGYFVSPETLDWLYIRLDSEDGSATEIAASPDGALTIDAARDMAIKSVSAGALPE